MEKDQLTVAFRLDFMTEFTEVVLTEDFIQGRYVNPYFGTMVLESGVVVKITVYRSRPTDAGGDGFGRVSVILCLNDVTLNSEAKLDGASQNDFTELSLVFPLVDLRPLYEPIYKSGFLQMVLKKVETEN